MSAILYLAKLHLWIDSGRRVREGMQWNDTCCLPHCISVPYFHLRKDYTEIIESFTEFPH